MSHLKFKGEWIEEVQQKEAALPLFKNEMQKASSQQQRTPTQTSTTSEEDDVESFFPIEVKRNTIKKTWEQEYDKYFALRPINSLVCLNAPPPVREPFFLSITPHCQVVQLSSDCLVLTA